jgi:hypothetical protein
MPFLPGVPPDVISQRRIPAESESVVPASQQRVPGADLQKAVPPRKAALRLGGSYSEVGGGDVTDGVIIVGRVDASRKLQGKLGEDMGSRPVLVCLCLVLETRELSLEPTIAMTRLAHRATVAHHKLTLAQRYKGGCHPGC